MSGGGGRGRRRRHEEEEHVNHERWLVSYSDMITVLMGLFIVLYAMSQVDQAKFEALRESLSEGFGITTGSTGVLDGSDGALDGDPAAAIVPAQQAGDPVTGDEGLGEPGVDPGSLAGADPSVVAEARQEASHLVEVRDAVAAALADQGLQDAVSMRIDERGLTIGLVADDVFFAAASADLTDTARQVLDAAGPTLAGLSEQISVEGHANVLPVSGRYPTNWELSADRATQVLRHLVDDDGIAGSRIMAVGFGDQRPLVPGDDDQALAANRRVDLVILSSAPEKVRELLPQVIGTEE